MSRAQARAGAPGSTGRCGGFTFIEVLCVLMTVGIGMLAIVGVAACGLASGAHAQGRMTGLATAISVAVDPQPLLDPGTASDWSYSPYPLDGHGTLTSSAQGFINGYYAVRTETSVDADIVAQAPGGTVYARSASVAVDVFDTAKGSLIASYSSRILRQRPTP